MDSYFLGDKTFKLSRDKILRRNYIGLMNLQRVHMVLVLSKDAAMVPIRECVQTRTKLIATRSAEHPVYKGVAPILMNTQSHLGNKLILQCLAEIVGARQRQEALEEPDKGSEPTESIVDEE